ncbi:DUF2752 domain-containing protein [bacterium]|nr:DUF2752 domain-containing protein [bacterium]
MRLEPGDAPLARWLGVAAAIALPLAPRVADLAGPCAWRQMTGLRCPTCGTTRALGALASGDVTGALLANPLAVAAVVIVALWAVVAVAQTLRPRWRRRVVWTPAGRRAAAGLVLGLIVANWLWLLLA